MTTVFLAPHNDDETLFGAYTLLRYQPFVIVCLRSERMGRPDYPGGMPVTAETREAETEAAMTVLGCDWTQWEFSDAAPDWQALDARLHEGEPEHVFAPAVEQGGHEQHNEIGRLALATFGKDRVTPYLTYTRHGGRSQGVEVTAEPGWAEIKQRALACYQSQAAHPMTRMWFNGDQREFYAP